MKKLLLIKLIVLLINLNVICQTISSNGWHMPLDVEMKMLVVFAEFKGETTRNTPNLNVGINLLQLNSFKATETKKIIIE